MNEQNQVRLLKVEWSKQVQDKETSLFGNKDGVYDPPINFDSLFYAYDNSSIISGIITKIATKGNVWFIEHKNKYLDTFLKELDMETLIINYCVFGVAFFERLKTIVEHNTLSLDPIITFTMRVAKEDKKEGVAYFQRSKNWIAKVPFSRSEILFIKRASISDKHYGDSIFSKCIDEVVLLAYITKYYKRFFKGGNIEPNILYDETGSLTEPQIDKIEAMINDKIAGIDNSHNTVFVPGKIGKIDLSTKIDPDKFIALKRELKEDIAIATNIPFELISPENSNKATSQVALQTLYSDIIVPMLERILQQLKAQLKIWLEEALSWDEILQIKESDIDDITFVDVEIKDSKEEMEIFTGYKDSGIYTSNEIRKKLWEEDHVDGNSLEKRDSKNIDTTHSSDIKKIKESVHKMYQNV